MTALERIQISLTPFEKVQILRAELEDRQEELRALDVEVRDKLQAVEVQRYLESLSPYYAANPRDEMPTREELEALETKRLQLFDLIQNIEATLPVLLQDNSGASSVASAPAPTAAPTKPAGTARKASFDSF